MRWVTALLSLGCASGAGEARTVTPVGASPQADPAASLPASVPSPPATDASTWATHAASPSWRQVEPRLKQLVGECPVDGVLVDVAAKLAEGRLAGQAAPEMDEISFGLRRGGSPYVWPRAWALYGTNLSAADAAQRVERWLASFDDGGQRRCGVAWRSDDAGNDSIAVLAVDVLADLTAMPTRARAGQWGSLDAELLVPVSDARVVLLGPRGAPRLVTATRRDSKVRARFLLDQPGPWVVQLLPTTASGPRPALEVSVFVDTAPPSGYRATAAPGEQVGRGFVGADGTTRDVGAIESAALAMLNGARQAEGLGSLSRDLRLDALAREHAAAMEAAGRVGHDLGQGGPLARLQAAGLISTFNGENLAHATSASHAHRALWASPSHRGNMLNGRFVRIGVGAKLGVDGSVWLCQIYAG